MRKRNFRRSEGGATAAEFALTFPIFIALAFGTLQASFIVWTQLGMQNAVEAAARCAVVNTTLCPDAASIASYAAQNALGLNLPASTFSTSVAACGRQVSGAYSLGLLTNNFPVTTITINAQSCLAT